MSEYKCHCNGSSGTDCSWCQGTGIKSVKNIESASTPKKEILNDSSTSKIDPEGKDTQYIDNGKNRGDPKSSPWAKGKINPKSKVLNISSRKIKNANKRTKGKFVCFSPKELLSQHTGYISQLTKGASLEKQLHQQLEFELQQISMMNLNKSSNRVFSIYKKCLHIKNSWQIPPQLQVKVEFVTKVKALNECREIKVQLRKVRSDCGGYRISIVIPNTPKIDAFCSESEYERFGGRAFEGVHRGKIKNIDFDKLRVEFSIV